MGSLWRPRGWRIVNIINIANACLMEKELHAVPVVEAPGVGDPSVPPEGLGEGEGPGPGPPPEDPKAAENSGDESSPPPLKSSTKSFSQI